MMQKVKLSATGVTMPENMSPWPIVGYSLPRVYPLPDSEFSTGPWEVNGNGAPVLRERTLATNVLMEFCATAVFLKLASPKCIDNHSRLTVKILNALHECCTKMQILLLCRPAVPPQERVGRHFTNIALPQVLPWWICHHTMGAN